MSKRFSFVFVITLLSIIILLIIGQLRNAGLLNFFSGTSHAAASSNLEIGIQAGQPIDDSGNILITDEVAQRMKESGAQWVRVNFRLGPYQSDTPGFYNAYDYIVDNIRSHGMQIIGLMSNESVRGSQADWVENSYEYTRKDGYNTYIDQFGYAFARMAKHWEGKITYWEIWNEPNAYNRAPAPGLYPGGSYIYPSNFAAMLTHAYSQVRYYNHIDVKIISGGLFSHNIAGYNRESSGANYLSQVYGAGITKTGKFNWAKAVMGTYPLDFVGQHIYLDQGTSLNTTQISNYLNYVHNVGVTWEGTDAKNTWITEFGWNTKSVEDQMQSNNLKSAVTAFKNKSYVAAAIWFQLDDNPASNLYFGLYRPDLSQKPSWATFYSQAINLSKVGKTATGATNTSIQNYYYSHGGAEVIGKPFDNGGSVWVHYWDYGYVQDFDGGSIGQAVIFDTGYRLDQGFLNTYFNDNNHNLLRFPVNDAHAYGQGTRQDFQGGFMTWDPVNNVQVILNAK